MNWQLFSAFLLITAILVIVPGPIVTLVIATGASRGIRAALRTVIGTTIGNAVLLTCIALGLSWILKTSAEVFDYVRLVGAAYLVWLAYDGWRDSRAPLEDGDLPRSPWTYFRRGFVTNVLNPKAALFFVSVLPSFVDPTRSVGVQTTVLVALYVLAATLIHSTIVLLASPLTPFFRQPRWRQAAGVVFGVALVGVAIWLLLKTAG
jgi:threonine/homoserine/homoserine lactone efflux protein